MLQNHCLKQLQQYQLALNCGQLITKKNQKKNRKIKNLFLVLRHKPKITERQKYREVDRMRTSESSVSCYADLVSHISLASRWHTVHNIVNQSLR